MKTKTENKISCKYRNDCEKARAEALEAAKKPTEITLKQGEVLVVSCAVDEDCGKRKPNQSILKFACIDYALEHYGDCSGFLCVLEAESNYQVTEITEEFKRAFNAEIESRYEEATA
jgi:hypothetical protein